MKSVIGILKKFHEQHKWIRNSAYGYKEKMFQVDTQIVAWRSSERDLKA